MNVREAFDPFRALPVAWQLLKAAPVPLLLGGFLVLITSGGGGGGNFGLDRSGRLDEEWIPILIVFVAFACCLGLAFFLFSSWMLIGFGNTVAEVVRRGTADVAMLFDGRGRFWRMVFARLLVAVAVLVTILPWVLGILALVAAADGFRDHQGVLVAIGILGSLVWLPVVIYVGLGLMLVEPAVALEGLEPVDALRRSWSLASGSRWMLLGFSIVTGLFTLVGVCACCIGVFVTGTLSLVAKFEAYLAVIAPEEHARSWVALGGTPPASAQPAWDAGAPPPPPPPVSPPAPPER